MKSSTLDIISYVFLYVSLSFSLSLLARAVALNLFA
jgi:hypothetical protein